MAAVDIEFWRLPTVLKKCGMSKTQLYRRLGETDAEKNPFPKSRPYRGGERGQFWLSSEVQAWQRREVGIDIPDDVAGLLG